MPRSKNPSSVSIDIRSEPPPSSAVFTMITFRSDLTALLNSPSPFEINCKYRKPETSAIGRSTPFRDERFANHENSVTRCVGEFFGQGNDPYTGLHRQC